VSRLRELMVATAKSGQQLAIIAKVTKQTFSGYLNSGRIPSVAVLGRWVLDFGLNANWLLTGKGHMLLETEASALSDPIAQRVDQVASAMRGAGVDEMEVLRSVRAMVDGEMAKLAKARGGYGVAEPVAGMPRAAEQQGAYPGTVKPSGDDTV